MKTYAITIKPESAFGTPLKGDTIFGHFCWQAAHHGDLLNGGLERWIDEYPRAPFAVFSSAWPTIRQDEKILYFLPRPAMPIFSSSGHDRKTRAERRKEEKKKKWLQVPQAALQVDPTTSPLLSDKELFDTYLQTVNEDEKLRLLQTPEEQHKPVVTTIQMHNSINRLTMTTGKDFAPFSMENHWYLPGLELVIFVAIEEEALDPDNLKKGLSDIGSFGFGRDASSGLGRFSVVETKELDWPLPQEDTGCLTLAPCVPEENRYAEHFCVPFTRFGRHGDKLVLARNPFKNPVIMADEGAVFFPFADQQPGKPFIGTGNANLSLVEKRTVGQGYAICLPISRRSQ